MEAPDTSSALVEMRGIVKRFAGVVANDGVDFELRRGEVHALLGENGAGKTTLMNVLYGLYKPERGKIRIRGREVSIQSPSDAIKLGIGMIHQNFRLIDSHTVAENIILKSRDVGFVINKKRIKKRLESLIARYGWRIDPDAKVWQLSAGEKQQVEILKLLYRGSEIMIFDEPTSVLTPQESRVLFSTMRQMASEGKGIVLITHKLDEVLAVSDRVTVMRRGRVVLERPTHEVSKEELAIAMVGRPVLFSRAEKRGASNGSPTLSIRGLHVVGDRGLLAVKGVDLDVYPGEVVGIAGISGNGQVELAEAIVGLRRSSSGRIIIGGEDVTNLGSSRVIERGVAYIPPEGPRWGLVGEMRVLDNLLLKSYRYRPISNRLIINWKRSSELAHQLIKQYEIATPSIHAKVKALSGGNMQRLILARELSGNIRSRPRLVVAAYPTRGLDVGAAEYVRDVLIQTCNEGAGVLLISEDLEEIFQLSDRIAVMFNGRIVGIVRRDEATLEGIGLLMAGGSLAKGVVADAAPN